jgi:hypothetical protein
MVWYKPTTWGQPKQTVKQTEIAPTTTATRSIDIVTVNKTGQPTGGGAVTLVGKKAWSSGGGSGTTPASQVVDASFTSGGSASGQGGTTYNSATNSSETNIVQSKTYDSKTGTWSSNAPYKGQSQADIQTKYYKDVNLSAPVETTMLTARGTRTDLTPKIDYGVGNKPTIEDVKPTGLWGNAKETWNTAWGMTPVGIIGESVSSTIKRQEGIPLWTSWSGSQESVRQRKLDKLTGEWQIRNIEQFNRNVGTVGFTEAETYNAYKQGQLRLYGAGIKTEEKIDIGTGTTNLYYTSPNLNQKTGFEYLYDKGNIGQKIFLTTAVGSSVALKTQVELLGLEFTGIPSAIGRGYAYTSAVLPRTASVLKYGAIGGLTGLYGLGKVNEYSSTSFKPEFWTKTAGEVSGFTLYTMSATGNLGYEQITKTPEGKTEYGSYQIFGKPIATKTPTGWEFGYPKEFNVGASTADLTTRGFQPDTKVGLNFYNKFKGTYLPENLQMLESTTTGALKTSYKTKVAGGEWDLTKSKSFSSTGMTPEAQKWLIQDIQSSGLTYYGGTKPKFTFEGLGNALIGRGTERYYGSVTIRSAKGINREVGDIDKLMRGSAIKDAGRIYNELKIRGADVKWNADTGLIQVRSGKDYVNLFDIHGADLPDLNVGDRPFGFKSQKTTPSYLSGQPLPTQTLTESTAQKIAGAFEIRTDVATGKWTFQPRTGQEKSITDLPNMLTRIAEVSSPDKRGVVLGAIENYINIQKTRYPNIQFRTSENINPLTTPVLNDVGTGVILSSGGKLSSSFKLRGYASSNAPSSSVTPSSFSLSSLSTSVFRVSASPSASLSPSPSPSPSSSPYYFSPSPSPSPSIFPSPSISPSPSMSPSPSPSPSFSPSPFSPVGWANFPSFGFDEGNLGTRKYKGKQRKKYTPSFEALVGFAKGSTSKKTRFTGLEVRGIPKGFTFANNKFKIPRLRL